MSHRHGLSTFCLTAALIMIALAAGCRTAKPEPLVAPQATYSVEHFTGTPVSGALPKAVAMDRPEDALAVNVTMLALNEAPIESLEPLSARTKLIVVTQGTSAVQSSPMLTLGARVAATEQAAAVREQLQSLSTEQVVELQTLTGALPAGATAVFAAAEPGDGVVRRVAVEVSRPLDPADGAMVRLALLVEDHTTTAAPREESDEAKTSPPPAPATPLFQREIIVMDDMKLDDRLQTVLVAPFRFARSEARAVAFLIDIAPGSQAPAHLDAVARSLADLERSASAAAKRPAVGPLQIDALSGLHGTVARLSDPTTRRAALVYLTVQTGSKLCGDIVLVADDSVLEGLVQRIEQNAIASPEEFGWMLDRSALQVLTELSGANKLPAEMSAVLTLHAGEPGRHAGSLEEISRGLTSRQDFENRLVAENLIYLEDNSPASRVRAYDWLRGVGRAPANYDPLGSPRQRREALDRALTVAANPTTQQAQP